MRSDPVTVFLCGDVMLGRGVDQILPHPGDPSLQERYVDDARTYVELARRANGPVPQPVDPAWPWGEALRVLDGAAPDARVINLETAVTRSDDVAVGKSVHYRMNPDNLASLHVARPDVCVLANNHVLDHGPAGLAETLEVLADGGLQVAGAGRDVDDASAPAVVEVAGGGRVLVFAVGMATSGIPHGWAATADRAGVAFVAEPSDAAAEQLVARIAETRRPGDVVIVSVHWGPNWGYDVSPWERRFAHALIDGGVDVVHGHSSHHPRPIEVHRGKLILYGCGDLIDDYEGISGHERYRPDLRLLYLASVSPSTGALHELRMVPMQARRLRLERCSASDARWLQRELDRASRPFGARIQRDRRDEWLTLEPVERSG